MSFSFPGAGDSGGAVQEQGGQETRGRGESSLASFGLAYSD